MEKNPYLQGSGPRAVEDAAIKHLSQHPGFLAEYAKSRNELFSIPSGATGSRKMKPAEQKFLTNAFKRLQEDFEKHPFRIHGESGITGNKKGEISEPVYNPAGNVSIPIWEGDRYNLHTHPPFGNPPPLPRAKRTIKERRIWPRGLKK